MSFDLESLNTSLKIGEDGGSREGAELKNGDVKFPKSTIITTIIVVLISLYFITIGSSELFPCSAEPRLPIWMILCGVFLLLERALAIHFQIAKYKFKRDNKKPEFGKFEEVRKWNEERKRFQLRPLAQDLMWLAIFIEASFGAVWLKKTSPACCDPLIFYPSVIFCALILIPSSMGVFCLCACCCYKKLC